MVHQGRRNGEQVATRQFDDLVDVAEAGAHHLGAIAIGLEVIEDLGHGDHARILRAGIALTARALLVPIKDAPHERGNQRDTGLGTGHRLGETEQQGEIAMNAILLETLGGADPLPGGGDLDQHPLTPDSGLFIKTDQLMGLRHRGLGVVAQARVHLGGHAAGHDLEDLLAEGHADLIESLTHHCIGPRLAADRRSRFAQGTIDQILISRDLGGRQDQ